MGALALFGQGALADETEASRLPKDAFKKTWKPAAPVHTTNIELPVRGKRAARPDISLKLAEKPDMANLKSARAFRQPLRTSSGESSPKERRALAALMREFVSKGGHQDATNIQRIGRFLENNSESVFSLSLLLEKAEIEWKHGYFTDALETLRSAWATGKDHEDITEKRMAESAYGRTRPQTRATRPDRCPPQAHRLRRKARTRRNRRRSPAQGKRISLVF